MKTKMLTLFFVGLFFYFLPAQNNSSTKEDFLKMAQYLSTGSGKWITPNPKYNSEKPFSAKAFGLWFTLKLNKNLLLLTHVVYRRDTAHVTGESYWLWHPGEHRIKYYSLNFRGGFTDGETYFQSDNTFTTTDFRYTPNGHIEINKDENVIMSELEHRTTSSVFKKGQWEVIGEYLFKRSREAEQYKFIKHY